MSTRHAHRRAIIAVACDGSTHRVVVTVEDNEAKLRFSDHDTSAESVFVALGGTPSACGGVEAALTALRLIEPDLFQRSHWLRAGVWDPLEVASWKAAGYSPPSASRWRAAGVHLPATLDAWRHHGFRSREAIAAWQLVDISPAAASGWRDRGYTVADATRWKEAGVVTADHASGWDSLGVDPGSVTDWRAAGVDDAHLGPWIVCAVRRITDVRKFLSAGIADGEDLLAWTRAGVRSVGDVERWVAVGINRGEEAFAWAAGGVGDPSDIAAWRAVGVQSGRQMCAWFAAGVRHPSDVQAWRDEGVHLPNFARDFAALGARPGETLQGWIEAGVETPGDARRWIKAGVGSLTELAPWKLRGIDSRTAIAWIDATQAGSRDEVFAWFDMADGDLRAVTDPILPGGLPEPVANLRDGKEDIASKDGRPDVEITHSRPLLNGAVVTCASFYAYGRRCSRRAATHASVFELAADGDVIPGSEFVLPVSSFNAGLDRCQR